MKNIKRFISKFTIGSGLIVAPIVGYANDAKHTMAPSPANTQGIDAADQALNASDVGLTAKIRKQLMNDSSLSTSAKNITIVSNSGHVTLSGKVTSSIEKRTVETTASQISGPRNYTSYLEVNPKSN